MPTGILGRGVHQIDTKFESIIFLGDFIDFCGLLRIYELYHGQHTQINLIYNDHALDLYLHKFG